MRCNGQTGVEMEALTAVSVAAPDDSRHGQSVDKAMVIENICPLEPGVRRLAPEMRMEVRQATICDAAPASSAEPAASDFARRRHLLDALAEIDRQYPVAFHRHAHFYACG